MSDVRLNIVRVGCTSDFELCHLLALNYNPAPAGGTAGWRFVRYSAMLSLEVESPQQELPRVFDPIKNDWVRLVHPNDNGEVFIRLLQLERGFVRSSSASVHDQYGWKFGGHLLIYHYGEPGFWDCSGELVLPITPLKVYGHVCLPKFLEKTPK